MSATRIAARSGYPVSTACEPDSCPRASRYFQPVRLSDGSEWVGKLGDHGMQALDMLPELPAVLVPSADDAAQWLSEIPVHMRDRFKISLSSAESLRRLQDKQSFGELVRRLNVPHPWTRYIESTADLAGVDFDGGRALFLKPTNSQDFVTKFGKKAVWASSAEQAVETCRSLAADGIRFVIQEYVTGGPGDHYFIDGFRDRKGIVSAVTARRRIRIYPPGFGNSSYCESIPMTDVSDAWTGLQGILEEENYRGIFSAEFKQDRNDGQFKILEINTRPWVYVEFAYDCGLNMIDMYIQDALDQPVASKESYTVGLGCVNLYGDIFAVLEEDRSNRPGLLRLIGCWINSSKLLYRTTDPGPALRFLWSRVRAVLRKLFRTGPK